MPTNNKNLYVVKLTGINAGAKVELVYDPGIRCMGFGSCKLRKRSSYGESVTPSEAREAVHIFHNIWEAEMKRTQQKSTEANESLNEVIANPTAFTYQDYLDRDAIADTARIEAHDAYAIFSHTERMIQLWG